MERDHDLSTESTDKLARAYELAAMAARAQDPETRAAFLQLAAAFKHMAERAAQPPRPPPQV